MKRGDRIGPGGRYLLEAPIGEGGQGTVFRAKDEQLGRDVAVKVLHPSWVADPRRMARLRREAQLLVRLKHPRLVSTYDVELSAEHRPGLLGGVSVITGKALALFPSEDGRSVVTREHALVAIPYNVWSHRGEDQMQVWLPRRVSLDFQIP